MNHTCKNESHCEKCIKYINKEVKRRKSKLILHGTEKTSNKVKGRHARPKFSKPIPILVR